MDREAFANAIEKLRQRTPFHPFTIVTVSGERIEIDRPEAFGYRGEVAIFAGPGSVPWIFDHEGVSHIVGDLAGQPKG